MTRPFVCGIPCLNNYAGLERCLQALFAGSSKPEAVYIVDNGRKLFAQANVQAILSIPLQIHVINPVQNLGLSRSWNMLNKLAWPLTLCLVNDDVVVGRNTMELLARDDPPVITTALGWSCFRHDHEAWKIIGDYDEHFVAFLEDNDMDRRRELAGVRRVIAENDTDPIQHSPSTTLRSMQPHQQALFQRHHRLQTEYYALKHGGQPGKERFTVPFNGEKPVIPAGLLESAKELTKI